MYAYAASLDVNWASPYVIINFLIVMVPIWSLQKENTHWEVDRSGAESRLKQLKQHENRSDIQLLWRTTELISSFYNSFLIATLLSFNFFWDNEPSLNFTKLFKFTQQYRNVCISVQVTRLLSIFSGSKYWSMIEQIQLSRFSMYLFCYRCFLVQSNVPLEYGEPSV